MMKFIVIVISAILTLSYYLTVEVVSFSATAALRSKLHNPMRAVLLGSNNINNNFFELKGVIKDESGSPVPDVLVYSQSSVNNPLISGAPFTFTDKKGGFILNTPGKIVFASKFGFNPVVKVIGNNDKFIHVVLTKIHSTESIFSVCLSSNSIEKRVGGKLKLLLPEDSIIREGISDDSRQISIAFDDNQSASWLILLWGQMASHGFPQEEWILNSSRYTVNVIKHENYQWAEYQGQTSDGRYWRFVGRTGEQISYYGVPKIISDRFNQIINNSCISK